MFLLAERVGDVSIVATAASDSVDRIVRWLSLSASDLKTDESHEHEGWEQDSPVAKSLSELADRANRFPRLDGVEFKLCDLQVFDR